MSFGATSDRTATTESDWEALTANRTAASRVSSMHPVRAEPTTMEHVMRITKPTRFPERRGARLTKAAGWIAIAFGAVHVITAPLESRPRDIWSQVVDEGWWNTFTLDKATTLAELERSETFWVTLGSFGVPVLVLGFVHRVGDPPTPTRTGVDRLDPPRLGAALRDRAARLARLGACRQRRTHRSRGRTEKPSYTATQARGARRGPRRRVTFRLDRQPRCAGPGERPVAPAGTHHSFENTGEGSPT
jgi:hypothetical protein